jgi:hypothetical protein
MMFFLLKWQIYENKQFLFGANPMHKNIWDALNHHFYENNHNFVDRPIARPVWQGVSMNSLKFHPGRHAQPFCGRATPETALQPFLG